MRVVVQVRTQSLAVFLSQSSFSLSLYTFLIKSVPHIGEERLSRAGPCLPTSITLAVSACAPSRTSSVSWTDRRRQIDRYVGISPQQFDFSSRGVNVRTAPSTERDFNLLAGNWVFIPKKTDDEQSVEPARDSASKPKQHQGAAAASAEKAKKKKKPEKKNLEKLTTFERERLERIARNKEQLAALNIGPLAANMNDERGSGGGGAEVVVVISDVDSRTRVGGCVVPSEA